MAPSGTVVHIRRSIHPLLVTSSLTEPADLRLRHHARVRMENVRGGSFDFCRHFFDSPRKKRPRLRVGELVMDVLLVSLVAMAKTFRSNVALLSNFYKATS